MLVISNPIPSWSEANLARWFSKLSYNIWCYKLKLTQLKIRANNSFLNFHLYISSVEVTQYMYSSSLKITLNYTQLYFQIFSSKGSFPRTATQLGSPVGGPRFYTISVTGLPPIGPRAPLIGHSRYVTLKGNEN